MTTLLAEANELAVVEPTPPNSTAGSLADASLALAMAEGDNSPEANSAESDTAGKPARAPRRAPTDSEVLAANQRANKDFARQYQGATIKPETTFRNHTVVRTFTRTWAVVLRNWLNSTTQLRTVLKDSERATKVEMELLDLIAKIRKGYAEDIKRLEHILANNDDSAEARASLSHQNAISVEVPILGPVAFQFRALLITGDELLDMAAIAYTLGEIPPDEHERIKYKVKRTSKSVDTLARNIYRMVLQSMRQAGLNRPGYQGGTGTEAAPASAELSEIAA